MELPKTYNIKSRIWINTESGTFLGEGRIELLRQNDSTGSISKAAKSMKMSYKKAWELVSSMNTQFNEPLVVGSTGGLNGGGSVLSEKGKNIVAMFLKLNDKNKQFLQDELNNIDFFK